MSAANPISPTEAMAEAIRQQLGTDAVVLIVPGDITCAVVVSSRPKGAVPGTSSVLGGNGEAAQDRVHERAISERLAYSVREAAAALGLSSDVLYDEMRTGRLQSLKVGRRPIITRAQVDDFLNRLGS